jgi:hypothetical protein
MQCIIKKGFGDKYITKIGQVCRIWGFVMV